MKPLLLVDIFKYLTNSSSITKIGSRYGYYALGDAYNITGMHQHRNKVVLVEFRFNDFTFSQYNHWKFTCEKQLIIAKPTVNYYAGTGINWRSPQEKRFDKLECKELNNHFMAKT